MKLNWLTYNWIVFNSGNGFKMMTEYRGIETRSTVWNTIFTRLDNMACYLERGLKYPW